MQAALITKTGGPDVFEMTTVQDPHVGDQEILIRQSAIGLNFIDTYRRSGLYPVALPAVLGSEGAGVVEAVGAKVTRFKVGDRAAYAGGLGAYADKIAINADLVVKPPASIAAELAAASMLKGMTAAFLTRLWPLLPGDPVLVHAAAGGVGSILTQWLKSMEVMVIGAVGSAEKAKLAKDNGCDHVIVYDQTDTAKAVRDLTKGEGVRVVYDSVGQATFEASLACVARRGLFVSFGNASGAVPAFAPLRLSQAGSIFFCRPSLFDFITTPEELDQLSSALFQVMVSGAVKIAIAQRWPLAQVGDAHRALEGRQTTGASLLIP